MNTDLFQYLRKRRGGKNVKSGVLLGRKVKGRVLVGWSKCKLTGKNPDTFDVQRGLDIAQGRIQSFVDEHRNGHQVPPSIEDNLKKFVNRCKRYFKVKKVKVV